MDYGVVIINGVFAILRKSLHKQITMEASQREEKLNTGFRPHCPSKIQKWGPVSMVDSDRIYYMVLVELVQF